MHENRSTAASAWLIVALLVPVAMLNYLDRQMLATGYGLMNLVSISCGGCGDWAFGALRDRHVPLNLIFGGFAGVAVFSVVLVLLIRPRDLDTVKNL